MPSRKLALIGTTCVACGTCVPLCPVHALSVPKGLRAVIDANLCIGCGKCERNCPAGVIAMVEREGREKMEGTTHA